MRPTGLGHGVYKDDIDYSVFSGEWLIGCIYERKGIPDDDRFFWSLHGVATTSLVRSGDRSVEAPFGVTDVRM